ncbi:hypothetical protein B0T10DRAFT_412231 [Thelonectria olida]|uniref:Uncharacterized protein n=1 Tax=Thelonectria olida TaxID=1576542 RepID=A0A9P8VVU5_9HYPO|nr:hypothetical protein B0T10DRAFT_412231 [Thelonectria olida]
MTSTRTNLGPLTTEYKYPASCQIAVQSCDGCDVGWQAQTCSDNGSNAQGVQDNPECWPERANPSLTTKVALNGWGYYSPGLSCPEGYHSACSATGTGAAGFSFQFPLLKSETAVGCCPEGFRCKEGDAQTCYSLVTTGSFAAVMCSDGSSNDYGYVDVPKTVVSVVSESTATSVLGTVTIYAPLFQLNFQSSDLPSSSTAGTDSTEAHSTETQSAETSRASDQSDNDGGLSVGAKAGIGAGVGALALLIIGVAVFLFLRKRRGRTPPAELPSTPGKPPPQGLYSKPVNPSELESTTPRSELP